LTVKSIAKRIVQATQIFTILRQHNSNPTTELVYASPFELLVSVVLSAQATDVSVNKATARLFVAANTPKKIFALGISGLEPYIKSIGLYKTKAKNIIGLCEKLILEHNSEVPQDFDSLVELPGVGRKTANVVLNTLFGEHAIAVDTHIFRVSNRLGIAPGNTPLQVETGLQKVVPIEFKQDAHHWLILHGRYVCVARTPKCERCVINQHCDYYANAISTFP
jgi:endonuclease III